MKKLFEQPKLMVVQMSNRDIVTISLDVDNTTNVTDPTEINAAGRGRFEDWDAGY